MAAKKQNDDQYSTEYWREEFKALSSALNGTSIIKALVAGDSYYDSVDGFNDYRNIISGRSSLEKTRNAVLALKSSNNSKIQKAISRQGLKIPK
jgi:hypothetical protein